MVASAKVQAGHVKRNASTGASVTLRTGSAGRLGSLNLKANAVVESVTSCFRELEIYVFTGRFAIRVLHRNVHFVKNPHVIQATLRIQHLVLAKTVFTMNLDFLVHDKRMRVIEPGNQHPIDKDLWAFRNFVSDIDLVGIIGLRLRGVLEFYLGKPEIVVS